MNEKEREALRGDYGRLLRLIGHNKLLFVGAVLVESCLFCSYRKTGGSHFRKGNPHLRNYFIFLYSDVSRDHRIISQRFLDHINFFLSNAYL